MWQTGREESLARPTQKITWSDVVEKKYRKCSTSERQQVHRTRVPAAPPDGPAQVIVAVGEIIRDVTDPLSYLAGRKMPVTP